MDAYADTCRRTSVTSSNPDNPTGYDSRPDTLKHSLRVGTLITQLIGQLLGRVTTHDLSKTEPPEVDYFDRLSPRLAGMRYTVGGQLNPEYQASLAELAPALEHHYAHNRHHPEFHESGIDGMTLVDLVEMLADWKASTERTLDGDLRASIITNTIRFGLSDQLASILLNTAEHLGWIEPIDADVPAAVGERS
jgi:hypothetical protein